MLKKRVLMLQKETLSNSKRGFFGTKEEGRGRVKDCKEVI